MSRAVNKLEEAEFFLEKIRGTNGHGKQFLFYLSAFVSAGRSIGLVLQADYRGNFGAEFDDWWEEIKQTKQSKSITFETIRELRNNALKRNDGIPFVFQPTNELAVILTYEFNPITESARLNISIRDFNKPLPKITRMEKESDNEYLDRQINKIFKEELPFILSEAEKVQDFEVSGYILPQLDTSPIHYNSMIDGFLEYLAIMREIVEEAICIFGKPKD